jgi:sugar/nucleoside kinase (ribokinase family)
LRSFVRHGATRLQVLEGAAASPQALVIGHVHADRDTARGGQGGGITQSLIERFSSDDVPVYANFGRAQYALGTTRWEPYLDRLACFQLDIEEMRAFSADAGIWSLEAILAWFRPRCTVAVTTERMGAVAQLKGSENVILAWPYDLQPEDVVDTTGAGDAFGAGIVASSLTSPLTTDDALLHAVETAVLWSAYACTTLGGAGSCPDCGALEEFAARYPRLLKTECKPVEEALPMLRLLDRVFPPRS